MSEWILVIYIDQKPQYFGKHKTSEQCEEIYKKIRENTPEIIEFGYQCFELKAVLNDTQ